MKMLLKSTKRNGDQETDHWAFLEEIDAPMWIDLIEETKQVYENGGDDEWFNTSHPFHQCSAQKLRVVFSHSVEGSDKFGFNLLGTSSPKLPSSVSKSRGKEYRISSRGKDASHSGKQRRFSGLDAGVSEEHDTKGKHIENIDVIGPKTSHASDSCCNGTASASSEVSTNCGDTNHSSTITSVGDPLAIVVTAEIDQQKNPCIVETSKLTVGQMGGLVSSLRINLRKSCATRQASRVEINRHGESKGSKSSMIKPSTVLSSNAADEARSRISGGNLKKEITRNGAENRSSGKLSVYIDKKTTDKARSRISGGNLKKEKTRNGAEIHSSGKLSVYIDKTTTDKTRSRISGGNLKKEKTRNGAENHSSGKLSVYVDKTTPTMTKQNRCTTNAGGSKGCRPSSGKPSTDSSISGGCKVKSMIPAGNQRKDRISDGTVLVKNSKATKRGTALKPSGPPNIQARNVVSNSKSATTTVTRTSSLQKDAMSKVPRQTMGTKATDTARVNIRNSSSMTMRVMKKECNGRFNAAVHPGKENDPGSMLLNRDTVHSDKVAVATLGAKITKKMNAATNSTRESLIGPKTKGKSNGANDGIRKATAQRVYFR